VLLTEVQYQYLKAIQSYSQESNRLPTIQTLADMFEVSKTSVNQHLKALIKKGYVHESNKLHGISYRKDIDINTIEIRKGNWKRNK